MPDKIVCPFTSYLVYPAMLILDAITLEEALAMPCSIVRQLTSNPVYSVILVHYTKTLKKSWRKILRASGRRQAVGWKWAYEKPLTMSVSECSYFEVVGT